jgi:hypothetical protein
VSLRNKNRLFFCFLLSFLGLSVAAQAQDLDSELNLKARARWIRDAGIAPNILECRLSEQGHLQCVSDEILQNVQCEGTHYTRLSEVKALFRGRAFSCEGTRYDKNSALTQWTVLLRSERGAESRWKIDAADEAQLRRLYELELKTLNTENYAVGHYYSLGLLGRLENMTDASRLTGVLDFELGQERLLLYGHYAQVTGSLIEIKTRFRLGLGFALDSELGGRGWILKADTGHLVLVPDNRVWGHCLGPEYRWNPGTWSLAARLSHCWYQGGEIKFSPQAELRIAKKLSSGLYLLGGAQLLAPQGRWSGTSIDTPSLSTQLGVSFSFVP